MGGVEFTKHGKKRLRKRFSLDKRAAFREATRAWERGLPRTAFTGSLRRYLDSKYLPHEGEGIIVIVHNNGIWIFQGKRMITTYPLPQKYTKLVSKINKVRKGEL